MLGVRQQGPFLVPLRALSPQQIRDGLRSTLQQRLNRLPHLADDSSPLGPMNPASLVPSLLFSGLESPLGFGIHDSLCRDLSQGLLLIL